MSKNQLKYKETKLIKNNRTKKKSKVKVLLLLMSLFVFVFLLSNLVAKIFNFNFLNIFNTNSSVSISSHSYYAVSMGEFDELNQAQNFSGGVMLLGGAGYVWCNESKYYVLASVYSSKQDAQIVKDNIGVDYDVSIVEISFNKLLFDDDVLNVEQNKMLKSAVDFIDEVYNDVYNFGILFDKSEILSATISSGINTLKGQASVVSANLDMLNSVAVCNQTLIIKNAYIQVITEMESVILKIIEGGNVSQDIKYLSCSVAINKYNMFSLLCE